MSFETGSATNAQQPRFFVPDGCCGEMPLGSGFTQTL